MFRIDKIPLHSMIDVMILDHDQFNGVYEYIEKMDGWEDVGGDRTYLYNSENGVVLSVPRVFVYDDDGSGNIKYTLKAPISMSRDPEDLCWGAYIFTHMFGSICESDDILDFLNTLTVRRISS